MSTEECLVRSLVIQDLVVACHLAVGMQKFELLCSLLIKPPDLAETAGAGACSEFDPGERTLVCIKDPRQIKLSPMC